MITTETKVWLDLAISSYDAEVRFGCTVGTTWHSVSELAHIPSRKLTSFSLDRYLRNETARTGWSS